MFIPHSFLRRRFSRLGERKAIGRKRRVAPREHLRSCIHTQYILVRRKPLVVHEVLVKGVDIAAEVGVTMTGSDKAVNLCVSLRADDKVELRAVDVRRCGWGGRVAVIAEGVDIVAEQAGPDHDLVCCGTIAGGAKEGIIGDVAAEAVAGVAVYRVSDRLGVVPSRGVTYLHDQVVGIDKMELTWVQYVLEDVMWA